MSLSAQKHFQKKDRGRFSMRRQLRHSLSGANPLKETLSQKDFKPKYFSPNLGKYQNLATSIKVKG